MIRRALLAAALLAAAGAATAQAFTTAALQRLLQDAPKRTLRYTETRESPWLDAPVQASGTLRYSAGALEKVVEQPRRETWRILDDRMQRVDGASAAKEIRFADVPAMAALANAMRSTLSGDLQALERDFALTLSGDPQQWTLQLKPRRSNVSQHVKQLELRGTRGRIDLIEILESRGERTTTHLTHDSP
jgi:hypothetical protein